MVLEVCSLSLSLSLSGACHEDVSASTSRRRHAGLSIARRLAVARPKLSGRRSSSTVLSQVCLGLPVLNSPRTGTRLFVPSSDFSYRRSNSTATNENGVQNNIRKPKRRQIETATYILLVWHLRRRRRCRRRRRRRRQLGRLWH